MSKLVLFEESHHLAVSIIIDFSEPKTFVKFLQLRIILTIQPDETQTDFFMNTVNSVKSIFHKEFAGKYFL